MLYSAACELLYGSISGAAQQPVATTSNCVSCALTPRGPGLYAEMTWHMLNMLITRSLAKTCL